MKFDDAINLLKQVCAAYRGNLEEHNVLQQALKVVSEKEVKKKSKKAEK
jgi:hypothetical protein